MRGTRTNLSDGKVIDTWHYVGKYHANTDTEIALPVRLCKAEDPRNNQPRNRGGTFQTREVRFKIELPENAPGAPRTFEGTDIEILREAVFDYLDDQSEGSWTTYFRVVVAGSNRTWDKEDMSRELTISYDTIEVTKRSNGKWMYREEGYRSRYDYHDGLPWESKEGRSRPRDDRSICYVLGTDENEEALKSFLKQIDTLREKISGFLTATPVITDFVNMAAQLALPAPKGKKK